MQNSEKWKQSEQISSFVFRSQIREFLKNILQAFFTKFRFCSKYKIQKILSFAF